MKVQMHITWDLANLSIATNTSTLGDGRPPLYFLTSNQTPEHLPNNPSITLILEPPTIDLAIPNPHHASSLYQTSSHSQNLNTNNSQTFPHAYQIPTQRIQILPTTQPMPVKTTFHVSNPPRIITSLYRISRTQSL